MPVPVTFPALGTTAVLLVSHDDALARARELLATEIAAIDVACSRFRTDSELHSVNERAGYTTRVSPLFIDALDIALRAARVTDGRVDPTVGSAMRILGYDRDFGELDPNGPPLSVSVRRIPGWRTIEVDRDRSAVRIARGVELDFGATAKAFCADRAARAIAADTGAGVVVSLGGDIAVDGPSPETGWRLFITDDHTSGLDATGQHIVVRAGGVATSGTSVRRWRRGTHELHHVIDPASGRPAHEHWRTATVAAATCVDANIGATAAIVIGGGAPGWLEARGLPARLVRTDGAVVRVAGWPGEVPVPC